MLKKLCQSMGLAAMVLVMNYGDLLGGGADVRMHVPFSLVGICIAQIADIILLGLAIFAVIASVQRTRFYGRFLVLLAAIVPVYVVFRMRGLLPFGTPEGLLPVLSVSWIALVVLLFMKSPTGYRRLIQLGGAAGIFFAVFAFGSILQLLWVMTWKPGPQRHDAVWAHTPQPAREHPRIVWVVFDELSYRELFEHRLDGLQLPNFDALRAQSTLFGKAEPIGSRTVKIIPSLFSGHTVDEVRFGFDNGLKVHFTGTHGWHVLDGPQTVFADAQRNGWRTGAVGWYNPYCTMYAGAIDDCYWTNLDKIDGPMAQRHSLLRNIWSPLQQMASEIKGPESAARESCSYEVRQRYETHMDLEEHSLEMLRTDQADFVFLHLAIPHSPSIWSRRTASFTRSCGSSYIDDLALADAELGRVLGILQTSPRWNNTSVIVQGDHGWRVNIWSSLPAWTEEDEEASDDVFDPRPAVLIHQAGQTQPATYAEAWSLLNVHEVIEQMVQGKQVRF